MTGGCGGGVAALRRARRWAPIIAVPVGVAAMQVLDLMGATGPAQPRISPVEVALVVGQCLPLVLRRVRPWWSWWAVALATQLMLVSVLGPYDASGWAVLPGGVALYALQAAGVAPARARLAACGSVLLVAQLVVLNLAASFGPQRQPLAHNAPYAVQALLAGGVLMVGWRLGRAVHLQRAYIAALAERATLVAREQQATARQAVLQERARMARDLHDVAAHHLSSMVVQAEALRAAPPGSAVDAARLRQLADSGRRAMDDMRTLLGVLRGTGDDPAIDAADRRGTAGPAPGLADLPALIAQVPVSAAPVRLTLDGDLDTVPCATGLTVYRIVQESLTNARRHAPGAATSVLVTVGPSFVEVVVHNVAPRLVPDRRPGGAGLVGMTERAGMHGGTVSAAATPDGGWTVRARLPHVVVADRPPT